MPRLTLVLFALVALLGAGLAYVATRPAPAAITEAQVRDIVTEALKQQPVAAAPTEDVAQLDQSTIDPMIETYLLNNPSILRRVSDALQQETRLAAAAQSKAAIQSMQSQIYDDPDHIVLGNPDGDVTLVEMFDYNCGYCRQALPDLATLLAEDSNLKVILKEFPILTPESVEAARVAVLVGEHKDVDYWAFHQKLFTSRGQVNGEVALKAAADLGLNRVNLALEMDTPKVTAVIDRSYAIAKALNVSGTPTYIIGEEIIPGAVGIDELRTRIANMRQCGKTDCSTPEEG